MPILNPYFRIWRPMLGYTDDLIFDDDLNPSEDTRLEYLDDDNYFPQREIVSILTTAHLIMRDIYDCYNYVEPSDNNLKVYSHRFYELLLRICTEFESNCKGILKANGYNKESYSIDKDYFKINNACLLNEYKVIYPRWESDHTFLPFESWSNSTYKPLQWYKDYNSVKHNRFSEFNKASFENVINAFAGLLCIIHAQVGRKVERACFNGETINIQKGEAKVSTDSFIIIPPDFNDDMKYNFKWEEIKKNSGSVDKFLFN